jgi:hypothetical protein
MMFPKEKRIRIQRWLDAANGEPCTWPGCDQKHNDTVVAAHSNDLEDGKGVGKKSHDLFIAFLCWPCHYEYDHGKNLTREEKKLMFFAAMKRTYLRLYQKGLFSLSRAAAPEVVAEGSQPHPQHKGTVMNASNQHETPASEDPGTTETQAPAENTAAETTQEPPPAEEPVTEESGA